MLVMSLASPCSSHFYLLFVVLTQSWPYAVNDYMLNRSYPYGALSTQLYSPSSTFLTPRFRRVYHIVRSPMKQIASVTSHSASTYEFILHFFESTGVLDDANVREQFDKVHDIIHLHLPNTI